MCESGSGTGHLFRGLALLKVLNEELIHRLLLTSDTKGLFTQVKRAFVVINETMQINKHTLYPEVYILTAETNVI